MIKSSKLEIQIKPNINGTNNRSLFLTFKVTKANDSTAITIKTRNGQAEAWIMYGLTREMVPFWVLSLVDKRIIKVLGRKMDD